MDATLKFESWRESIKRAIPRESFFKKTLIVGGGLVTLVASLVLGTY
jgi:hypothetical protein